MPRRDVPDLVHGRLGQEDADRGPSRHRFHSYGSHHEPVYMSGGLHPRDDIDDFSRGRAGLHRNWYHGGWDLAPDWRGGGVSSARRDLVRDGIESALGGFSRWSGGHSISLRQAEQDWYGYGPSDGFEGYHPGWYGTGGFSYGGSREGRCH
jgi:hypothetical protein